VTINLFVQEDRSPSGTGRAQFQTHAAFTTRAGMNVMTPVTAMVDLNELAPTHPHWAICAPMTEPFESVPLPDHPLLATWASALNDAGYWATLMDAEWRIVFVTDETLLTYRDMGAATPPPIGAHFLSVEWREYMETVLGASGSSEDLRASFLDTGRFVLAGTPGGREQLRRVLDPQLASFVDQLQP